MYRVFCLLLFFHNKFKWFLARNSLKRLRAFFCYIWIMLKGLKIALMLGVMFIASALCPIQVKAQEKKDSITVSVPVFTGNEKNLTDTLLAYGHAATSPEFQAVVTDAVTVIKAGPKENTIEGWYSYILAALASIFGVYQLIRGNKAKAELKAVKKE